MIGKEAIEVSAEARSTLAPYPSTAFDHWALSRIQNVVKTAPIRFVLWDGFELPSAAGSAVATLLFKERSALYGWMWDPELNFGETYMAGLVTVEGDLLALLEAIYRAFARPKRRAWWLWQKSNDTRAARENVHHHYDLGNDFYRLWLDGEMVYTFAYFPTPDASLEEASRITGASLSRTAFQVVLPLCMPAILSAGILVITRVLEEFAIPGVLGAPSGIYTITTYIYYQAISYLPPRYEVAALLASLLMGLTAILLWLQSRILGGGGRFTTVTGKGHPPRLLRLGPWRYLTLAYALVYIGLTVALPYLVLLYAAFISQWGASPVPSNFTLANFVSTFDPALSVRAGLRNSLILAVAGATCATLLTLIISYMITRGTKWRRNVLELVSSIPLAMPGPVMAVAMLWAYLHEPFVLYGTLWILLVA